DRFDFGGVVRERRGRGLSSQVRRPGRQYRRGLFQRHCGAGERCARVDPAHWKRLGYGSLRIVLTERLAPKARLCALPPLESLEREWRALEVNSDAAFYLSWCWIGTWLECLPPGTVPQLMRIEIGDRLVGLGLLARH